MNSLPERGEKPIMLVPYDVAFEHWGLVYG
jgi:hypothetical protein